MELKRYHPLTIIFELFDFIKNIAIFAFLLFVVNYGSEALFYRIARWTFLVVSIVTVITLIVKWFVKQFATTERSFHLKSGIFSKIERTVYYDKVQNVQRHTSFLHKLFRVTSITFETSASGADANVSFKVVTKDEADRMERLVEETNSEKTETLHVEEANGEKVDLIPERVIHFTPTRRDVVKASFTSLSFLFLIVIVASLFSKLNALFNIEDLVEGWVLSFLTSGWTIAAIATILIIISFAVGLIRTYFSYGKYEISSDSTRIYISKGVLDETNFSILKNRVQAIEITQSVMKRFLRLAEVKLISAGSLGDDEQEVSTLYPFLPIERAYSIIEELLPDYEVNLEAKRLPRNSLVVKLVKPYWFWLITTGVLYYFKPEPFNFQQTWWVSSLLLLVLLIFGRVLDYLNTRYALTNRFVQLSSGALTKTTYLTRRDKIIEIYVNRSKLQQFTGLATIGLVNRAKPVRHETLSDLPIYEADAFYTWYAQRASEIPIK